MEPETLLKIVAIALGLAILVFNFVDFNWLIDKVLSKEEEKKPIIIDHEENNDKLFLNIIDLWYKLRESCDDYGLKNAAEKLDEVFPLLNDKKDGEDS